MTKKPTVSILVNTYNYGHFIEETIDSLINQTFPENDREIIIVDDGSTDTTSEKLLKYRDKIKYIYKSNEGQASAFNVGFDNSQGEIIFFVDSDDIFYSEKVETIVNIYHSHSCNAVFNNMNLFGLKKINTASQLFEDYKLKLLEKVDEDLYKLSLENISYTFPCLSPTSGHSYKRELLNKILPVPLEFKRAADLYLHVMSLPYSDIHFLNKNLGNYRQHPDSFMNKLYDGDIDFIKLNIKCFEVLISSLEEHEKNIRLKDINQLVCLQKNYLYFLNAYLIKHQHDNLKLLKTIVNYKPVGTFRPSKLLIKKLNLLLSLTLPPKLITDFGKIYKKAVVDYFNGSNKINKIKC